MKTLLIGIPAYNEQTMIEKVLTSLPRRLAGVDRINILVVDDGSTDATAAIAQRRSVIVLTHAVNLGLGGALKTMFAFAHRYSYDMLITFDADGQHQAKDIPALIDPILKNRADVVIGSRWKSVKQAPLSRIVVNRLANILTLLLFGVATSDSQSGLRAFNKKAIDGIRVSSDGMEVSSEFFKEIGRLHLRSSEIPIDPIYTSYSRMKGQRLSNMPSVLFELFMRFLR